MTVGAALLVYAILLGGLGPLAYRRDRWLTRVQGSSMNAFG